MKTLSVKKAFGLSEEEVVISRKKYGANTFGKVKAKSFLRCFAENLGDPVIKILLAALAVDIFLVFRGGNIIETLGIGISVFLATLISTLSERGGEKAFRRLEEECSHSKVRVWRSGTLSELSCEELVVGDIIRLCPGEQIPADAFILSGNFKVDQSMITGESREVDKFRSNDKTKLPSSKSAVFRGCTIISGEGEAEVFSVGENSFFGKISDEIKEDTRESPLKCKLSKLAKQISFIGYIFAFLIALTYLFNTFVINSGFEMRIIIGKFKDIPYLFEHLLHAFMLGLTVIVMAVPEGLPMMIAVVLSSNIRRMIKDNVLVRKPVGIEAAGSMNILFTDKTGTLTEGKMSVSKIILADGKEFDTLEEMGRYSKTSAELYTLSAFFNTSSVISGDSILGGNSTDKALSASVSKLKCGRFAISDKLMFSSELKYSAVHIKGEKELFLIKGAPEKLLPNCKYAYVQNGILPFSSVSYGIFRSISSLTKSGGRVILIASSDKMPNEKSLGNLTFVCAVLLSDKLRSEAENSARLLADAGVHIVMITGDNKDTAEYIARKCGILSRKHGTVLTGEELSLLSDEALAKLLPQIAVIARALPSDKSRLVRVSQEQGLVVGMTGDGINDAPALKRADVGFAMGSGTDVAKDAGDIIILDNNLSSIQKAVLYGRTIFKSIRKFITLQLTMNMCAVGISMIGPFIGYEAPVTVVQMLWINMIMDTLGGLAFAGEVPRMSYMQEKPKRRDEPILNGYMISQIALSGIFTVALYVFFLLSPFTASLYRSDPKHLCLLTAFFALFIFTSVLHCFNCRTDRLFLFSGLSKNKAFILIISAVSVLQILFIYLGGAVLRTIPLTPRELFATLALSFAVVPADIIRKAFLKFINKKGGF